MPSSGLLGHCMDVVYRHPCRQNIDIHRTTWDTSRNVVEWQPLAGMHEVLVFIPAGGLGREEGT